ncbi:hypothetical protein IWQ60_012354 [Tieghemiomyces parasiticus]|uniref:Enoyl reductase (ER) domain-containing protein n=1 Tax=Tieghemiomyces parasiticus TaxID=78921 RepID=A0A9W7ZLJ9_9FUNG|nr:hypothetical protein IWQ60_012354 [Tieghemiomyces parasiticus]
MSAPTSIEPRFKCYALKAPGQKIEPWEYTPRPLGPHDVEVAIDHCGVCGTDCANVFEGWASAYPFVPGHEVVGHVKTLGGQVQRFEVGDRVSVSYLAYTCDDSELCNQCQKGQDSYCVRGVPTAGGLFADGTMAYGGFAESIRVQDKHVSRVPDNLEGKYVAPLVCGGATVFNPMRRHNVQAGDRVGIVGIGGLGHLAIQFARALGAQVTAFTTKEDKRTECFEFGANHVVNINDSDQVKRAAMSIDFLLVTSNSVHTDWAQLAGFMDLHSKIVLVGIPAAPLSIPVGPFLMKDLQINTSVVGDAPHVQATLDFAAEHGIRPWVEEMPMSQAHEALTYVRDGKARYRVVLNN